MTNNENNSPANKERLKVDTRKILNSDVGIDENQITLDETRKLTVPIHAVSPFVCFSSPRPTVEWKFRFVHERAQLESFL